MRAAGELDDVARGFAATIGAVAGAFDEDFDALAEEAVIFLLADAVLQLQEVVVAAVFDLERARRRRRARRPWCRAARCI